MDRGNEEFIQLEAEVSEQLNQQGSDHNNDAENDSTQEALPFPDITKLPLELPSSTPLLEKSSKNVPPQVSPMISESNETYCLTENPAPTYPQRINKGVPKK